MPIPSEEEQIHLAAYIQAIVTVCAYSFTGNERVLSETMKAVYEAISGRVAAEETVNLNKYTPGFSSQQPRRTSTMGVDDFAADTGVPIQLPNVNFTLWPGENLDPVCILIIGLGLIAGNDSVCRPMVMRLINKILVYGSVYAKRACPLALALMNLSSPTPELTDMLYRIATLSDINAVVPVGS
ncbi:26S proteasome non-ATPase regulatory subunit 2 [Giardia muris]|uniref:26S proteasome non-ATPase regulatory subunit 2 n=1 Tax=Giardia muris TaxID=5742 RepID=A0A4Z1T2Z7_GIAMU|nr:26S proteasome non-ATPase regulatory subunit 2 [Giardia muris]|eukprot:TNJ26929.1 26S proteasome non-ATPase regulatory subunit 2 [Giardia muris]